MSDTTQRQPAEVWPPGVFLQEEIDYRGWTVNELGERARLPPVALRLVLDGLAPMTTRTALRVGRALGTGPEVWLNLQAGWNAWHDLIEQRREKEDTTG